LGQADPIGRADAVRQLQSDPEANAVAAKLVQQLRLLAPRAQLPEIPEPRGARAAATPPPPPAAVPPPSATPAAPSPPQPPAPRGPGIASRAAAFFSRFGRRAPGTRRTQFVVALVAGLAIIVGIVVLTTGGGGGENGDCSPLDTSQATQAGIPTVDLAAVGSAANADCKPTGQLTLVPIPAQNQQGQQNQAQTAGFALQTNAAHLEPTSNGDVYVLWLYKSDTEARPLGQETVDSSGNLNGAAPLPAQELLLLQALPSIRLSRVTQAQAQQVQQSVQAQGKKATGVVPFTGTPVLEGTGTDLIQQLQQLIQQAQSQAGGGTGQTAPQGGTTPQAGAGTKQSG
jgi:hypothetical protein